MKITYRLEFVAGRSSSVVYDQRAISEFPSTASRVTANNNLRDSVTSTRRGLCSIMPRRCVHVDRITGSADCYSVHKVSAKADQALAVGYKRLSPLLVCRSLEETAFY